MVTVEELPDGYEEENDNDKETEDVVNVDKVD
jgi:hypothetical protein